MLSQEIRGKFLEFFKSQGHYICPSSPVIPHDDPTLLFINAGMNQFKDTFLGKNPREYTRACSSQKCIRMGGKHNDLENVGHTSRHLTFFEMMGNFSFGDYFKKEAIDFAWALSTEGFELESEKIWVTVYKDDDEAFELWKKHLPEHKIFRFGEKDNFWAMGDTGPCGPCSELYYDRGPSFSPAENPEQDEAYGGERYLEFWNLVFMQYNRSSNGQLSTLKQTGVDTGSGLERVVGLKQGARTVFETDILKHLIHQVEKVSGFQYDPSDAKLSPAFHVIADHIRSLSFSIADGAQPSNLDRGYVLRKTLRRAHRYGRMLNMEKPFLDKVFPALVEVMGEDYPELKSSEGRIKEILHLEEEAFIRTLQKGGNLLSSLVDKAQKSKEKQLSGEDTFKMKDTYGFPLEEIQLIAKDTGLSIDLDTYHKKEQEAKALSKKAHKKHKQEFEEGLFKALVDKGVKSIFKGYEDTGCKARVIAMFKEGSEVSALEKGDSGLIILDQTPFYAEKGGQVGDRGQLFSQEATLTVTDTQSPLPGLIVHHVKVDSGHIQQNASLMAQVEELRRKKVQANHTATHLMHWALCKVLGDHINQAGSYVDDQRLRFDFNHHKSVSREEIREIEDLVNSQVRENTAVQSYELSYQEAQKQEDIKQFFGDKYGTKVRVVDAGFSKELCGGTHTPQLGSIGFFKILKESSIAAGVRRIEAVTGYEAESLAQSKENTLLHFADKLKVPQEKLPDRFEKLIKEHEALEKQLKALKKEQGKALVQELLNTKEQLEELPTIIQETKVEAKEIKNLCQSLMDHLSSGIIILASRQDERCQLGILVSNDWIPKGFSAAKLIKSLAPIIQGGGGGKDAWAQAGGSRPDNIPQALNEAKALLQASVC